MPDYSNIEDLLAEDSFIRWISDSANAREQDYWEQWVAEDPAHEVMVREAQKLHESLYYDRFETPNMETELSELKEAIHQHEAPKNRIEQFSRDKRNHMYWMRVAAILLLAVVTGWGIYAGLPQSQPEERASQTEWVVSKTEYGEKRALQLSDGSKIVLNANSRLKYPARTAGNDLEVWLEGEAHFDIIHKKGTDQRQFTVHTEDGDVRVLGTQFNVNTRNRQTEVVLEEGKVRIEKPDSSQLSAVSHVMEPGELARFEKGQDQIDVQAINPALYTSWTEGRLLFEGAPLTEIANHIETVYGLEVRIASSELEQTLVSGAVSNDNLPVLLASLSRLLDVNIDRKDKLIIITD